MRTYGASGKPARPPCPDCGADDALRLVSQHRHEPPQGLRWLTIFLHVHVTQIYACTSCHELVLLRTIQEGGRGRSCEPIPGARAKPHVDRR